MNVSRSRIRNLGPASMRWLAAIDVHTREDLGRIGSVNAFRLLTLRGHAVSLNLLWAMEAALLDVHWLDLPPGTKDRLRAELAEPWSPEGWVELG